MHIRIMVVPQTHNKNHALVQRVTHTFEATQFLKGILTLLPKDLFLRVAKLLCQRVAGNIRNLAHGVRYDLSILHIKPLNLLQWRPNELRHNRKLGSRIDGFAFSVKGGVAHAVRVEVAAVGVAGSAVTVFGVGAAAGIAFTFGLIDRFAGVRCYGCGHVVCFPDVHFGAAGAEAAYAGVFVRFRRYPADGVGLAVVLAFGSVEGWGMGKKLTSPLIHFRSRGHWASQYPVPYCALGNNILAIYL